MSITPTFHHVFDALSDTPAEAANLDARVDLMREISKIVQRNGWTQEEAARHCGLTPPRLNDLLRGRVSQFSLDALVAIVSALGFRVHLFLERA
jgi:predicted XRE-type DNA-binding protein